MCIRDRGKAMKNLKEHPCFNEKARHKYGRIHIPIAPQCNVQCGFCNRKYDCVNESRPGVTSSVLAPQQALSYVTRIVKKQPNIRVVGIAGPGDAFATPEDTINTLKLIKEKFPYLLLCVSTNGLGVLPYINELKRLEVSHVTITVNSVDPNIGKEIYPWIRYKKRLFRGVEGAKLLLENQIAAIKELKKKDIVVKVNTIILPEVNDDHIEDIAKKMKELNVDILNCIPVIPSPGSLFESICKPSKDLLKKIHSKIYSYLPLMHHCTRCRADAVGLLGEVITKDAIKLLKDSANLPLNPLEKRPYIAVGSIEGILINQHLGRAKEFYIYKQQNNSYELVEKREAPSPGLGDDRWKNLAKLLKDCKAVLVSGAGENPKKFLFNSGVKVYEIEGLIEDGLDISFHGKKIVPIVKASCKTSCSGDGMGCG